jgi:hypothetical protein
LKEEVLDRIKWRNRFGGGCGPVVWQITDEWISLYSTQRFTIFFFFHLNYLFRCPICWPWWPHHSSHQLRHWTKVQGLPFFKSKGLPAVYNSILYIFHSKYNTHAHRQSKRCTGKRALSYSAFVV